MLKQISVSHRGWKGGRFSVALEGAVRETVLTDKHPASRNNVGYNAFRSRHQSFFSDDCDKQAIP